jgi:Mrp family chromosome partitioning ATPase
MSSYAGMDLPKLAAVIRARWVLLAVITVLAATLALLLSLAQAERYRATAVLLFGGAPRAETLIQGTSTNDVTSPEQATATNVALASLNTVAASVKQRLGTPATVEELKNAVDIEAQGQSDLVDLTAEWDTANGAALLATTFAEQVVALRREMAQAEIQRAIDALKGTIAREPADSDQLPTLKRRVSELLVLKAVQTGDVRVAERATPPTAASAPKPVFNAIIAGIVALVLGIAVVVLLANFDTRIHDERELAALISAPVLARIPEVARPRRFIPTGARDEESSFLEAVQFLRLNIQRTRPEGQGVVVAVTSPLAGDGKTMVVAWLAQALAFNEAEVLAVDFDLRSQTLHTYFDAREEFGGALPNLRLVRPDDQATLPVGLTGQEPIREMFEELRDKADYVVVDTSPVASVAHASAVAATADEVILIVDLKRIRRKDLLAAKEQLENARAKLTGIVLNRAAHEVAAYYPQATQVQKTDFASNP